MCSALPTPPQLLSVPSSEPSAAEVRLAERYFRRLVIHRDMESQFLQHGELHEAVLEGKRARHYALLLKQQLNHNAEPHGRHIYGE